MNLVLLKILHNICQLSFALKLIAYIEMDSEVNKSGKTKRKHPKLWKRKKSKENEEMRKISLHGEKWKVEGGWVIGGRVAKHLTIPTL
jgi:hypothetical protein